MDFAKYLWRKWLVVARIIGNFQGQVILTIFYFLLIWPLGIGFSLFADPFKLRRCLRSNFDHWNHPKENLEQAKKQF